MDFATLIGLIGAILLISSAIILGASPGMFINPPSLLIVIGGTLLVVLAKFSLAQFFDAFKVAARAFKFKLPETQASIEELVEIASIARKEGVLGIEGREVSSPFLGQGIQMLVDGQDVNAMYEATVQAVQRGRAGQGPTLMEARTYRYEDHSEGLNRILREPYRSDILKLEAPAGKPAVSDQDHLTPRIRVSRTDLGHCIDNHFADGGNATGQVH